MPSRFSFFWLLALAIPAQAQQDLLLLNNGWQLRGRVLILEDSSYSVQIRGGSRFVFPKGEVLRLETNAPEEFWQGNGRVKLPPGYYGRVQMAFLAGSSTYSYYTSSSSLGLGIQSSHGYRFRHWLQVGAGAEVSFYGAGPLMPLFGELRGSFRPRRRSGFYYLQGGYALPLYRVAPEDGKGNLAQGGLMGDAGIGLQFLSRGGTAWQLVAGYRLQRSFEELPAWWGSSGTQEILFRRLNLGLGLGF
jgi:hypothetical protein